MRYSTEQVAASRDALVRTAARIFREKGYTGVGVDELSQQAGVTSGSFYKHFGSKSDAFLEVIKAGADRVAKRVRSLKARGSSGPGGWVNDFATIHSSKEHLRSVGMGCNLPTLSVEVARADNNAKKAFEESITEAIKEMASDKPFAGKSDAEDRAVAVLSVLTGAMVIARAVRDPKTAQMITESARRAALLISDQSLPNTARSDIKWTPAEY
jgi:AcrR family transcriptional regulator